MMEIFTLVGLVCLLMFFSTLIFAGLGIFNRRMELNEWQKDILFYSLFGFVICTVLSLVGYVGGIS